MPLCSTRPAPSARPLAANAATGPAANAACASCPAQRCCPLRIPASRAAAARARRASKQTASSTWTSSRRASRPGFGRPRRSNAAARAGCRPNRCRGAPSTLFSRPRAACFGGSAPIAELVNFDVARRWARRFKVDVSFALGAARRARFSINDKGEPVELRARLRARSSELGIHAALLERLFAISPPGKCRPRWA